jgi:hypothetical protein
MEEITQRHLQQRRALYVLHADRVEQHVDATRLRGHGIDMLPDGLLVERVDLRGLGHASRGHDLVRDGIEPGERTAGEEDLRSLARERTGDRAAYRPSRSVDHGVLVEQQTHGVLLSALGGT